MRNLRERVRLWWLVRVHLPLREHPGMEWNNSCNFSQILRDQLESWTIPSFLWTVCFALILVVAIIGNCSVLWIVLGLLDCVLFH